MGHRTNYTPKTLRWVLILLTLALLSLPLDTRLSESIIRLQESAGGDPRRELQAWGQYGQGGWVIFVGIVFLLMFPKRRRRIDDLLASIFWTWLIAFGLKVLLGRPRPVFDEPWNFLGPFGTHISARGTGTSHVSAIFQSGSSELWSMPSNHTAFATMLSVFVAAMEPKLRILACVLACTVGFSRVAFGAHYPSDVFVGAAIGYGCASFVISRGIGVRSIDWIYTNLINRNGTPAWPKLVELDQRSQADKEID